MADVSPPASIVPSDATSSAAILNQAGLKDPRWLASAENGFYQPIVLAEAG
jgi:hypothetical protein